MSAFVHGICLGTAFVWEAWHCHCYVSSMTPTAAQLMWGGQPSWRFQVLLTGFAVI